MEDFEAKQAKVEEEKSAHSDGIIDILHKALEEGERNGADRSSIIVLVLAAADGSHKVTQSDVGTITLLLEGTRLDAKELHNQFKWLMKSMMWPLYEQAGVVQPQQDAAEQSTQEQSQQASDE
jgi:hypothetical protein